MIRIKRLLHISQKNSIKNRLPTLQTIVVQSEDTTKEISAWDLRHELVYKLVALQLEEKETGGRK